MAHRGYLGSWVGDVFGVFRVVELLGYCGSGVFGVSGVLEFLGFWVLFGVPGILGLLGSRGSWGLEVWGIFGVWDIGAHGSLGLFGVHGALGFPGYFGSMGKGTGASLGYNSYPQGISCLGYLGFLGSLGMGSGYDPVIHVLTIPYSLLHWGASVIPGVLLGLGVSGWLGSGVGVIQFPAPFLSTPLIPLPAVILVFFGVASMVGKVCHAGYGREGRSSHCSFPGLDRGRIGIYVHARKWRRNGVKGREKWRGKNQVGRKR